MKARNMINNEGDGNINIGNDLNISYRIVEKSKYIFDPQDLSDIINILSKEIDKEPDSLDDFYTPGIEMKNEINKIDVEFYEQCIKENYEYFGVIEKFLKNPANKVIGKKYRGILTEVKGKIYNEVKSGVKLQFILPCLFDYAKDKHQEMFTSKSHLLTILAYYMYAHCDIGEKYDKAK